MTMLQSDKELVEKLGMTEIHELSAQEKREFIDAQIEAIKSQLWRSRVDAMLNRNLKTEGETERQAVEAKIREHESDAKRYAEAITLLTNIKVEL